MSIERKFKDLGFGHTSHPVVTYDTGLRPALML